MILEYLLISYLVLMCVVVGSIPYIINRVTKGD